MTPTSPCSDCRDAWCYDRMYTRVWVIVKLLTLMMVEGERIGIFVPDDEAVDPISLEPFKLGGPDAIFFSVHPCA